MELLQSQKDQIYELIEEEGLSPNLFHFEEPTTYDASTYLRLKNSDYYFQFAENQSGSHFAIYSPGEGIYEEKQNPGSWPLQLNYVRRWLRNIDRELKTPNKWDLLAKEMANVDFKDIKYNDSKFTYQEYELLEKNIEDLKNKVSKLDLLEEQIAQIHKKLDHLLNLAKEMNKTDWKELFIGSLISLFMQLSIDKDTGQIIFGYIKNLFVKFLPSGA